MRDNEVQVRDVQRFSAETLNDFRVLVEKMGIGEVVKRMDEKTYWALYKYFESL